MLTIDDNFDKKYMFKNQKRTIDLVMGISELKDLDHDFFGDMLDTYANISFIHGSGKKFLGEKNYNQFMEDKWCMTYCHIKSNIKNYLKNKNI